MFVLWQAGGSTGLLMDLAANEKAVHADFFNGKGFFTYVQLTKYYIHTQQTDAQNCSFRFCLHFVIMSH